MEPTTLGELFLRGSEKYVKPDRFLQKRGGAYEPISSERFKQDVFACARGLEKAGIGKGDRVAILSYNRVEWAIVDYAAQLLGAPTVPLYSTLTADDCAYILKDSGAKILFVENEEQEQKAGDVKQIVRFDRFQEWLPKENDPVESRATADDLATLIYTSGTTGRPKGVMLTHTNLVSNVVASSSVWTLTEKDIALSFLPLSHIFERMVDYLLFHVGASIAYCETVDTVADNLQEVKPTFLAAVPRFYEKVHGKIQSALSKLTGFKKWMSGRALKVGAQVAELRKQGKSPGLILSLRYSLAKMLVLGKFHARTGGNIRYFVSGGAPLAKEIGDFFWAAGFTVLEGYGLTETSPVIAVNCPGRVRMGTVGPILPGVDVKIAEDGEILCKGPNVMKGYYNMPEATADVIKDGWFYTGDIGVIEDGFLKITDRKKDLIKTSGGKYIEPQPLESKLKQVGIIANAVVIGDRLKFPSVLFVPDFSVLREEGEPAEIIKKDDVLAKFQKELDALNAELPKYKQLKKFALLPADFSIEEGTLTPTMKVKRKVVQEMYKDVIEELYRE